MMKKLSSFSVVLLVALILCFTVIPSFAGNITVDPSSELQSGSIVEPVYPTIQEAVDAAFSGDTITVREGTYRENIQISGKSLSFVVDGEVNLTVPEPEGLQTSSWAEWQYDLPDMTSPVVSIDQGFSEGLEVSFEGFNFVGSTYNSVSSAGIFAGKGTSLTVEDCSFTYFMVPVLVTTYEDVFNDMIFDELSVSTEAAPVTNLEMTGCELQYYLLAGVSLVGPEVTGTMSGNTFLGMMSETPAPADLDPAVVVDAFRSAAFQGTLFSQGLDPQISSYFFIGGAGVLLLNSGENEEVTLTENTITGHLLGVGVLKDLHVTDMSHSSIQEIDTTPDTIISGNESISDNLIGVAVLGGFGEPLVWSPDYGIYLDDPEYWNWSYSGTSVSISDEENIEGNMIATLFLGNVEADVDSCTFTDNMLAGIVALGDLDGSVISNNNFSGTVGVNLLYGLGRGFEDILESEGTVEPDYSVEITGNTFTGNGLIEGAHEFISYLLGGEQADPLTLVSSMATRMGSEGPLAVLPDGLSASEGTDTPTLAGIILLDGVENVKIYNNQVTDSILGITAMDLGLTEALDYMLDDDDDDDDDDFYLNDVPGIYQLLIQNNQVTGNICGMTLLGARDVVRAAIYDDQYKSLVDMSSSFVEGEGLYRVAVSGNNISANHFGVINALAVYDLSFTGNRVENNLVLGMLNAGMGAWAFNEIFDNYDYLYDVAPWGTIFGNSFSWNGTEDCDLEDLPLGTETLGTYVKGGILVFDVPSDDNRVLTSDLDPSDMPRGLTINRNTIKGNGNYGLSVVGRVRDYGLVSQADDLVSTDLWLDATENFWGDVSGPSSYFGENSDVTFYDPWTLESADKLGDAITGIVFEEDGQYYPYDLAPEALYVRPLNCILFDEWLGKDGKDVEGLLGGEVVNGETVVVEQDMGDGTTVATTVEGQDNFSWTLVRYGENPTDSSSLPVDSSGYYLLEVENEENITAITVKFYSSSDIYWFNKDTGEWVKLTPSGSGNGYQEFTFNGSTNPTLAQILGTGLSKSIGVADDDDDDSGFNGTLFAESGGSRVISGSGGGCNMGYAGMSSLFLLLPLLGLMLKK